MWEKYLDIFHIWQLLNFPSRGKIRIGASTQPSTTSHLVFSNGFKVLSSENLRNDSGQSLQKLRTIIVFLSLPRRIPQRPSIRRSDITLADWKSDQLGSRATSKKEITQFARSWDLWFGQQVSFKAEFESSAIINCICKNRNVTNRKL